MIFLPSAPPVRSRGPWGRQKEAITLTRAAVALRKLRDYYCKVLRVKAVHIKLILGVCLLAVAGWLSSEPILNALRGKPIPRLNVQVLVIDPLAQPDLEGY